MDSRPNSKPIITSSQYVTGTSFTPSEKFQQLQTDQPIKGENEHEQELKKYMFFVYALYFVVVVAFCLLIEPILNAFLWLVTEVVWVFVEMTISGA